MVTTFFMGATIEVDELDEEQKMEQIKLNSEGAQGSVEANRKYEIELENEESDKSSPAQSSIGLDIFGVLIVVTLGVAE